jgi:OOP family OmpA-OmpF porin
VPCCTGAQWQYDREGGIRTSSFFIFYFQHVPARQSWPSGYCLSLNDEKKKYRSFLQVILVSNQERKMKNLAFIAAGLISIGLSAQTWERRWNVGAHGGFTQYSGDIGQGFYAMDQAAYGHVGISVSRYLNRHLTATLLFTRGEVGHVDYTPQPDQAVTRFNARQTTMQVLLKYNFLHPETKLRPYLFAGTGFNWLKGTGDMYVAGRSPDFSIPAFGAGINYRLGEIVGLQLQEMFIYSSTDDIERTVGGMNDMYVMHTIGVTFNFGKNKKGLTGVGERIDECPKVNNDSARLKKDGGGKARKSRKKSKK